MIITHDRPWLYAVPSKSEVLKRGLACSYSILIDGVCIYTKRTAEDFHAEGFSVLSEQEFNSLLEQHDDSVCGHWQEITKETYSYALDVLPPLRWYDGGFFVPEAWTADIYGFYQELNGRFYYSLQHLSTPRAMIRRYLSDAIGAGKIEDRTED